MCLGGFQEYKILKVRSMCFLSAFYMLSDAVFFPSFSPFLLLLSAPVSRHGPWYPSSFFSFSTVIFVWFLTSDADHFSLPCPVATD